MKFHINCFTFVNKLKCVKFFTRFNFLHWKSESKSCVGVNVYWLHLYDMFLVRLVVAVRRGAQKYSGPTVRLERDHYVVLQYTFDI